ncbi:MAG: DUF4979 domain-containing protein, partial [Muribaculaceae bacterium]|nr:DUF4979 domain-containing protein [Muribaculaceae bacterium]
MKKIYTTLCALVMGAMAVNAAGVEITFGGSEMPAHWTVSSSPVSTTVADGHLHVVMAAGSSYRADLKYEDSSKADMVLDPQKDKVIAVKFIGTRPSGTFKLEFNNGSRWYNTKWNGNKTNANIPANITTKGGNHIYYYELTADTDYADATELQPVWKMNFVIADGTSQSEYTIDWIKTFASVEEMEAAASWADDGENDEDEPANAPSPVKNETSGDEYNSFGDAFTAINGTDGHVLTLNTDQTTTERHIFNADRKNVIIQGAEGKDVTIYRGSYNKTQTMFESNSTRTTLRNLILSGALAGGTINQSILCLLYTSEASNE